MFFHVMLSHRPMTLTDTTLIDAIIYVVEEGISDTSSTHLSYPYLWFCASFLAVFFVVQIAFPGKPQDLYLSVQQAPASHLVGCSWGAARGLHLPSESLYHLEPC